MCEEIAEIVENVQPGRVFTVEDGGLWFSGMNANLGELVDEVGMALREEGYHVGPPMDDDAVLFGGLFLPVAEAEEIDEDAHQSIVSSPGGSRGEPLPN